MQNLKYCLLDAKDGIYYVIDGETLDDIALKFNTSKHLIITDNNLTGEVKSGDCLYVKRYKTTLVVGVEDTPYSVAKKLGISVEEMYKINKTNYIYPFMVVVND